MTDYEIIMIMLEVLALLISSSGMLIALLSFLEKKSNKHK